MTKTKKNDDKIPEDLISITKVRESNNEINIKEGHIIMLKDVLKLKEDEIMILKAKLELYEKKNNEDLVGMKDSMNQTSNEDNPKFQELKNILIKQSRIINEFRGSIVYPFYNITRKIGKTKSGRKLAKIIKKK